MQALHLNFLEETGSLRSGTFVIGNHDNNDDIGNRNDFFQKELNIMRRYHRVLAAPDSSSSLLHVV